MEVQGWAEKDVCNRAVFTGYSTLMESDSSIVAQYHADGVSWIVLDPCPFYAESGGQASDQGWVKTVGGETLQVLDVSKMSMGGHVIRVSDVKSSLKVFPMPLLAQSLTCTGFAQPCSSGLRERENANRFNHLSRVPK